MSGRRPNFLVISTDQQRADHLGCYGATVLRTPNIDSLASRGIRFDRAYVASPVCMPNRASLITGRMPSLHGLRHNGLNLSLDTTTIGDVLRAEGWTTALVGKAHFQRVTRNMSPILARRTHVPNSHFPEARIAVGSRYDQEVAQTWRDDPRHDLAYPYYGFETVDLTIEHGDLVEGHYSRWLAERHPEPDRLRGPENALKGEERAAPQSWRTAIPEELYSTRYIEERTIDRLNEFARDRETPFFLWASFNDPHHPFTPPGRYWSMYDPEEVDLPVSFALNDKADWPSRLGQMRRDGLSSLTGTAAIAVDEAELRAAVALTYGMISMIDDAVGAILRELGKLGLEKDTIVIFLSDHGDLMGEFGLVFKGPYHYQALVRIPLIWADGRSPGPRQHGGYVSAIDIAASMIHAAGIAPFNGMQGRPFVHDDGTPVASRDCVLVEDEVQTRLPGHELRGRVRTLMADGWRLTIYDGVGLGYLYNLNDDPSEMDNLWDEPSAQPVRSEMMERLVREMIAHSETSPLPEYAA
ncbi:MAG: sulfatase-like hydrolase/transferase [Paracoccaceae bacterium]|nr:sulfatase-like hydrolase/transferase [Paracoccaceae bacterium]